MSQRIWFHTYTQLLLQTVPCHQRQVAVPGRFMVPPTPLEIPLKSLRNLLSDSICIWRTK